MRRVFSYQRARRHKDRIPQGRVPRPIDSTDTANSIEN